ncbi:MAG: type II secretion system protein GspK [Candidatus Omnitrophica bacterium]|nr:type II secretion system protein GspK [Candidatus Omnitrophota bacterium]MDD5592930.1 type II secretion system protein GspK [Candidatus Omnitrophota bacterium]
MKEKGQALILVVTILGMFFMLLTAFFVLSQAERTAALRHLDSLRAQYIAEAGVAYAHKVIALDETANIIDSLEDLSFDNFQGEDADLDGDGKNESKAFNVANREGNAFGLFSVRVSDEAARLNLNSVAAENLSRLFSDLGINSSKASALISRRPFNAKEGAGSILGAKDFAVAKDYLTIYSKDLEIDLSDNRRVYLNSSQPRIILEAFLNAGIKDAYQKAANLKDASDIDFAQTLLDRFSQAFVPSGLSEAGSWRKKDGYYEANGDSDNPGKFIWSNLPVGDGKYFCFFYGTRSADMVAAEPLTMSGEGLNEMVEVEGGSLELSLKPIKNQICKFSHIELVSPDSKQGLSRRVVTGTEALVINELMIQPAKEVLASNPGSIGIGQIQKWVLSGIEPGYYYVAVQAQVKGGLVGDVYILGGIGDSLRDGDYFPDTVEVGGNGTITIEIRNNSLEGASFKGIRILQEPDGEFIEVLNLSPRVISLDDFSVEAYTLGGELVPGWPARIPKNTDIEPYQHLVLAVDNNDVAPTPKNLRSNKISFQGIYKVNAVGLLFDETAKNIDKGSDLLPDAGGRVILKDSRGERIDAIEYQSTQLKAFTSLERPDPSAKSDTDGNGFFDGWYLSESQTLSTPGAANENSGMYTRDEKTGKLIKNNISQVKVLNQPFSGLAEAEELSSGENWKKFSVEDIARMADHFSYEAIPLDMYSYEKPGGSDTVGTWEFSAVPKGSYSLSVLTDDADLEGKEIRVAVKTVATEEFNDPESLLFISGSAFYGEIEIPGDPGILQIQITAGSEKIKSGLKQIRLEPVFSVAGRVNINTAKKEVLRSILTSEALTDVILSNRPLGIKDSRKLGVGDLFLLNPGFIPFCNYFTVKSDVYEISSRGDFSPQGKTLAYQTIRTVIERGD